MKIAMTVVIIAICIMALVLVKIIPVIHKAIDMAEKNPSMESPIPVPDKMAGMEKYAYFCSDGGPFVLLPSAIKDQWKGSGGLINILSPKSDYGKACKVISEEGSHGVIDAYDSRIFVVDAPMLAMHKESTKDTTLFIYALVAWQDEDLDGLVDLAINATKEAGFTKTENSIQCGDQGFVFMYAGDIYGDCMYDVKDISAKAGNYRVFESRWINEGREVRIFKLSL